jgi:hypothetical protein
MKYPRIDPPYTAYAVGPRGARKRIRAQSIVVELGEGAAVEINLAPHPNFAGELVLVTPPYRVMKRTYDAGIADDFKVWSGGANVLHVGVKRRPLKRKPAEARHR